MFRRIAATAVVGLLLSGQAAIAAESARVGAVSGSVMVNQGGRMTPAAAGSALQAGDRVFVANGSASLRYGDGCNVAISARSMATVAAVSPCAYGSDYVLWLWLTFGIVTAAVVGSAVSNDEEPNSP